LKKQTPPETQRAKVTNATRTLIRLKHSLAAGVKINAMLPDTLEEFDDALARGELRELKASLDDVIGGA
jgi:hypothetical protein